MAGSPSIHWNKDFLLEEERRFTSRVEAGTIPVQVLIGFGEEEKSHVSRNSTNGQELSGRLAARGVKVEFKEFEDEGHLSVLPVLISRTLRFALRPDQ
ncbi:Ferri-bacillibactin esterase BesA [compost metagenome]